MRFSAVLLTTALLSATSAVAANCQFLVQFRTIDNRTGNARTQNRLNTRVIPDNKVDNVIANMYIESNGVFSGHRMDGGVKVTCSRIAENADEAKDLMAQAGQIVSRII